MTIIITITIAILLSLDYMQNTSHSRSHFIPASTLSRICHHYSYFRDEKIQVVVTMQLAKVTEGDLSSDSTPTLAKLLWSPG